MTEFRYPARIYLLAALLGGMTMVYSVARLAEAKDYEDTLPFRVQISRLAGVKQRIAGERKVGYLSDLDPEHSTYAQLYFPTQYVLAPTLLVPLEDRPGTKFVLGNFTRKADYTSIGHEHGLEVVAEFPMGVVLYRPIAKATAPGQEIHPAP